MSKFSFKLFCLLYLGLGVRFLAQTKFISRYSHLSGIEREFIVKHWTTKEGLPQNSILDIEQSDEGYLWLATLNGLLRFDGSDFLLFTPENAGVPLIKRISALAIDKNNGLWIGGLNGDLFYFKNNRFKDFSNEIKIPGQNINDLRVDRYNRLWIAADNNILIVENGTVKKYSVPANFIRPLTLDVFNPLNILVGTTSGLYIFNEGKYREVGQFKEQIINSIVSDKMGAYWIGTSKGLYLYKHNQVSFQPVSVYHSNNITYIFSDSRKRLWAGSSYNGLFVNLNYANCLFTGFKLRSPILKIFEDRGGNIWVGTLNKGLYRFTERKIYPITIKDENFDNEFISIYQRRNGEVWAGSFSRGVFQFINGRINNFGKKEGLTDNFIFTIYEDKTNQFWCGGYYKGLFKWTGGGFRPARFNDKLSNKSILALMQDNSLGLWIGTKWGLNYVKNNKIQILTTKNGLCNNHIKAIAQAPDGTIWVTTNDGIAYYKDNKFFKVKLPSKFKMYNCGQIYFDKSGRMWVGTYGQGLLTFYNGKIDLITTDEGLFNNNILTILEDDDGNFWFTSNKGLSRVSKKELLYLIEGKISRVNVTVFTTEDGLLTDEFNGNSNFSSVKLQDGTLLFPSMNGIVAVEPSINKLGFKYHKVFIDKVIVNNKLFWNDSVIEVPNDKNNITLHFSAISFYKPNSVKIRFRIKGYTDDWIVLGNNRNYNFINMPYGDYVVEVSELNGADAPAGTANIRLKVLPRFYQTLLFKLLIAAILLGLVLLVIQLRSYQLRKNKEKLERLIKVRTDEIRRTNEELEKINREKSELIHIVSHNLKNPLSVILNSGQLILEEIRDTEYVRDLTKIIINASNHMLQAVEELLECELIDSPGFSIKKEKINLVDLIQESIIKNNVNAVRKKQKIIFKADSDVIVDGDPSQILEVIDNYISNAIKYSPFNSTIEIKIEENEKFVKVSVKDQGPGLTEKDKERVFRKFTKLSAKPTNHESSTGLGLSIVKKIIELHGGKVGVESNPGKGSLFYFELPR